MGISGIWNKLEENVRGIRGIGYVTRRPRTTRSAWIMATMWAVAAMIACWSITRYVLQQNWGSFFLWWNVAILALDIYMLVIAVRGLKYRRNIDRVVKQLIEASRHA